MKRLLFALSLLLCTLKLQAQYVNINLVKCKISEAEEKKINKLIVYQRTFCNQLFNNNDNITIPIKINLYGSSKDFKAQKEKYKIPVNTAGFYLPSLNESFVYNEGDYIHTMLHEAAHCLFRSNFVKTIPTWLNEGLAEFFETLDLDENGNIYIFPQNSRIKTIKNSEVNDGESFSGFFNTYHSSFYNHNATYNYTNAYGIIYYFIKSKNTKKLKTIIELINKGNNSVQAFEIVYGSIDAFAHNYQMFYKYHK